MSRIILLFCTFTLLILGSFHNLIAQDKVLVHIDEMPYFPGCNDFENNPNGKRKCSNYNLVAFISTNLKYPEEAKIEGLEGTVIVSFIITKEGYVKDAFVLKDIGGGCGEEALSILNSMPRWEPGIHNGEKVNVKLNLPVKFSLSGEGVSTKYRILWGNITGKTLSKNQIKTNLLESILVKGPFGENISATEIIIAYERKKKFIDAVGLGKINIEQKRLLKRVRKKGIITISATLQIKGDFIEVDREFEVVKNSK